MAKVQEASLKDLHPTQLTVGLIVVEDKRKHLAALSDAGLVESERSGRETHYRLTDAGAEWDDRLDALRRHLERGS